MKIAVVTATITGREEMLARCVYSVAIQTRRPDRHLIGNGDGRPEADVLNELIGGSDCHAYIVLNDDDLLLRTYVEKCVRKLRDADVVYAWPRVEGRPISFNELSVRSVSLPVTALVRKSLYDNIGGYAPKVKTGANGLIATSGGEPSTRVRGSRLSPNPCGCTGFTATT